ncbi:alpha/beta hydrolase [Corynebacterium breve]|uniref:Alpha/beta hydrolase n=1 Tax=Corynebacterium breve TaxID=3049799 RepID=A0ABY8VCN5_9CORY|nr:alpha/beta hydrolase [Corynebacterium breve]WIM66862.1 alpha/beta hydrolase [Corynebacterium breve]
MANSGNHHSGHNLIPDLSSLDWHPDELGPGFERADIHLGQDPEGEGVAVATLVRTLPAAKTGKPALLWVHGMTDYFFQTHVAEHFTQAGYPFYALDLRKCGRARQEGQRWHFSNDLAHYFPDLTAALRAITQTHDSVVPIAHSTGGLIVPLWASYLRSTSPELHKRLGGIILNSPWLDMMYPTWQVRIGTPLINVVGKHWPNVAVPGGNLGAYGESLHTSKHGEWDFDLVKKPIGGHTKYLGWLRTVILGQKQIQEGHAPVGCPVLTLCSSHSYLNQPYSAASNTADTVLDVEQIKRWAPQLSDEVQISVIDGARHDVFLSLTTARKAAFDATTDWLEAHFPTPAA